MMSCPFNGTQTVTDSAPLATSLPEVFPAIINQRYRSIEDPVLVREILSRPEDFTPANALNAAIDLDPATLRILARGKFSLPPVLASASGPQHLAVRRVLAGFFSPARVAAQNEFITQRTEELCAELQHAYRGGAEVDLAKQLAAFIPPEVMTRLTKVPAPPMAQLKRWSKDSLELFWGWPSSDRQRELAQSAVEYHRWLRETVKQALGRDDGNLYLTLHQAGVDRARIVSLAYFLGIAGQETTAMLIQSTLFSALADGDWAACAQADSAARASQQVVAKVLTEASSVPTWRRVVSVDTQLGERGLAAGEQLVLRLSGGAFAAANDDSLVFGFGLHRCLGAGLARMESEIILRAAAAMLPELELTNTQPRWEHLISFQTTTAVPTRMRAEG